MATRLYFDRDAAPAPSPNSFTPSLQGSWGSDMTLTGKLITAAQQSDSGFITRVIPTSASIKTMAAWIFTSQPMAGSYVFDTSTTYTLVMRVAEELSTMNSFMRMYVCVLQNDGTLIDITGAFSDTAEMVSGTSPNSRCIGPSTSSFLAYTSIPGDRLQIEMGFDQEAAVAGDFRVSCGDSTTSGDLTEADGDTGVQNPWFETSLDITFDAEGTTYGSTPSRLMLGLL